MPGSSDRDGLLKLTVQPAGAAALNKNCGVSLQFTSLLVTVTEYRSVEGEPAYWLAGLILSAGAV